MRIVILGAGQVGATLAKNLAKEDNDITLVDMDSQRLKEIQHRLDIKTIHGCASHPNILIDAGIEQADMLIAVTNSDEINMMGCQIAYSLFRTPNKIARIRSRHYYKYPQIFTNEHVPVDVCISPEKLVTDNIAQLIDYPGVSNVLDFSEGNILLVTIQPKENSDVIGKSINHLETQLQAIEAGTVAIFRNNETIQAKPDEIIQPNDELIFIASPQAVHQVLITLGKYTHPNRRIIIAGGGRVGNRLAQSLEEKYRIKIIERDLDRANYLATQLHKTTVLQGDIADRELLLNENIEFTDVFCAVTNDDESNIMACLQAKKLGTRHVMSLVNRSAYVDLIDESTIDHALSPQLVTIGSILTKMRRGNMVRVHRLSDNAEAIELIIHGNESTSKVIGRKLHEIELPPHSFIIAIMRNDTIYIADDDITIQGEDHLILLVLKRKYIRQIESLFQVNLSFVD